MARKIKMKPTSTNVRYITAKQRSTHFFLTMLWHLVPKLTEEFIAKRFLTPLDYGVTPLGKQYLERGETFRIHVHGKEIQCWKWGRGPSILFVHGWNGRGVQFASFFESLINAGYSVITYDAPAHGASEGETTNYFEFTDTVRSFLDPSGGFSIQGIVAHSLGASAVINALSKENVSLDVVLIAPALKLKELMYNMFNQHGIPKTVYQRFIAALEERYGYNMHQDNPYTLAKEISSKILIVHDKDDPTTPFVDSKSLSEKLGHVDLYTTEGLGHKRILKDKTVVDVVHQYIFNQNLNGSQLRKNTILVSNREDKMREKKYTVKDYQKGGAEKRLSLFLEYPLMRREFIRIEQGELQSGVDMHHHRKSKWICNPFTRLLKWCH